MDPLSPFEKVQIANQIPNELAAAEKSIALIRTHLLCAEWGEAWAECQEGLDQHVLRIGGLLDEVVRRPTS